MKDFWGSDACNPFPERGFDLNKALYSDLVKYSIPQLLRYEDKNSMRWSIESRLPFLDYRLVELVASLPSDFKIHSGVTKYILRMAIKDLVSDKIIERRDKIGFAIPDEKWLASPSFNAMFSQIIGSKSFASRKYWDQQEVLRIFEEQERGIKGHGEDIWRIINLELWLRIFIEGGRNSNEAKEN